MKRFIAPVLIALSLSASIAAPVSAETSIKQLDAEGRGGHQK